MQVIIINKVMEIEALVSSESQEGAYYRVNLLDGVWGCTCPYWQNREKECKHIKEVKESI